jgi:hypothetical protein
VPKAHGGSNRISNLVLSCKTCNRAKGSQKVQDFLSNKPEVLKRILTQLKKPLNDAAAVNATRNRLFTDLLKLGLPVATGTGAQTKHNRTQFNIHKTHALDAACVGEMVGIVVKGSYHLGIRCQGRGQYKRTLSDKHGFPRAYLPRTKGFMGFQTGDMARTLVSTKTGIRPALVRIAIRTSGVFSYTHEKKPCSVNWKRCIKVQSNDGYMYARRPYEFYAVQGKPLTVGPL